MAKVKRDRSNDTGEFYPRQGARRPYVTCDPCFEPVLTHRQKTASGTRYRARTAPAWGRMLQIMEGTGLSMKEFVAGLSSEELARGRLRDHEGKFRGRAPSWVPREFFTACVQELMSRGALLYRENYIECIRTMTWLATSQNVKPGDRLKAAQFVIERLEGKVPDRLEISTEQPWQAIITDIIADVSDEQIGNARKALAAAERDEIMEAEVIEEEQENETEAPPRRRKTATMRRRRSP